MLMSSSLLRQSSSITSRALTHPLLALRNIQQLSFVTVTVSSSSSSLLSHLGKDRHQSQQQSQQQQTLTQTQNHHQRQQLHQHQPYQQQYRTMTQHSKPMGFINPMSMMYHPYSPLLSSPYSSLSSSSSQNQTRYYSQTTPKRYSFDRYSSSRGDGTGMYELGKWPITKPNTILNIVPQGKRYVVERFGKLYTIHDSGYFFAIPFVDTISYVVDVRERAIDITPQAAITKDNVSVEVSGNLFVQFKDPEKAAYGARNPLYSVTQHAQSAMRSAIGEMELDEILHGRARLNSLIKGSLQEAAVHWGMEVRRYEITEITPDEEIRIAMDKQAAAERARREQVLRAEGEKRTAELSSEGVKISLQNESEGMLIKIENEAKAAKTKAVLEAEGEALAVMVKAKAQAEAISRIAAELQKVGGEEAARLALARDYVDMYGEMGSKSNTMFFNQSAGDVTSLLVQAASAVTSSLPKNDKNKGD